MDKHESISNNQLAVDDKPSGELAPNDPFSEEKQEAIERNRRIRKIVRFLNGDPDALKQKDANVSKDEIDATALRFSREGIDNGLLNDILNSADDPVKVNGFEKTWQDVSSDYGLSSILIGGQRVSEKEMDPSMLDNFLKKYPSPVSFYKASFAIKRRLHGSPIDEALTAKALGMVALDEDDFEKKYNSLIDSRFAQFKKIIYGERQDYFDCLKELYSRGKEIKDLENFNAMPTIKDCDEKLSDKIMNSTMMPNKNSPSWGLANIADYEKNGLRPKKIVEIGDARIAISDVFDAKGHDAVIGYVKKGDNYMMRSFYQSNSQGLWRLLPDYIADDYGQVTWFGKGYSEEMTNLPSQMQKVLSAHASRNRIDINDEHSDRFLLSTAKRFDEFPDIYDHLKNLKLLDSDSYKEIEIDPAINFGLLSETKSSPDSIKIDNELKPNFDKILDEWESNTDVYGHLHNTTFNSNDGKLKYTFSEDDKGRAFISNIEYLSAINSSGVRRKWVSGGDVETPLYEYREQSSGYGDETDVKKTHYVCMWENYLSKMEIIKEYLQRKSNQEAVHTSE